MTAGDLEARVQQRLDELSGTYYPTSEILSALNEAQRFFCLLTLCLENTVTFPVPVATAFFHMISTYPDWLLPLRVYLPNGAEVRPARLDELDALDVQWQNRVNTVIRRYAALGFDFLALYPQASASGGSINITYAASPLPLSAPGDIPQIPPPYHPALADYAVYRCRFKEGGQEFAKGLPYFNRFLDEAKKMAEYVRERNIGMRYERGPFELEQFDRSMLLSARPDLVPLKKR